MPVDPLPGNLTCDPLLHLTGSPFLGKAAFLELRCLSMVVAGRSAPIPPRHGVLTLLAPFSGIRGPHTASLAYALMLGRLALDAQVVFLCVCVHVFARVRVRARARARARACARARV